MLGEIHARSQAPPVAAPDAAATTPAVELDPLEGGSRGKHGKSAEDRQPILRALPPGLDANPPAPDDLKAEHLTWKGEYQATKDGQPVLGPDSRPIPVLYNTKGKRVKSKVKPLHTHPLTVVAGTLTVDGWTGKARLNYDIPGQDFLYFSSPSIGTVIVSQTAFPDSREQKFAMDGKTLTIHVSEHEIQLSSDKPMALKKPESVWVRLDTGYRQDPRYPVMGYGAVTRQPYAWPAATLAATRGAAAAPPLPQSMMPTVITPVCLSQVGKPCVTSAALPAQKPQPARSQSRSVPATMESENAIQTPVQ